MNCAESKPSSEEEENYDFKRISYKGYHLFRIWPRSDDTIENLKILSEQPNVQLWLPPVKNMSVDIVLPPNIISSIKEELKENSIEFSILSTDIQKLISDQNPRHSDSRWKFKNEQTNKFTWTHYHSLDDISNYLEYLRSTYSNFVDLITIGKSAEGRDLKVIRISSDKSDIESLKPAIWIDAGVHAREWISPAVALFIIKQLVEFNNTNKNLTQNVDWYILPVSNPDGYIYTHTTDRLWKKSRSTDDGFRNRYFWEESDCKGVDLNRNWDFRWNEDGSSENPCHDTYAGRHPFSEPETRAMSNFILEHRDRIIIYLTLHSYSQMWLMPSNPTKSKSNDYDDLLYMGRKAVESLKKLHGTNYKLVAKHNIFYPTSGNSDDWAKNKVGIKYSYTIELRDRGTYGFLLPPSEIIPTGKEIFTAIRTLTKSVLINALDS
ncbi:hypothetical protein PGB90_010070 [Kerria lacca]